MYIFVNSLLLRGNTMNKSILISFLLSFSFLQSTDLRVMTFNMRYNSSKDTGDRAWKKRLPLIKQMIKELKPDIIGAQELRPIQLLALKKGTLLAYGTFGDSRESKFGFPKGEYNSVFYKRGKLSLKKHGTFWLNKDKKKEKKGWDARDLRICTWGRFKIKKDKKTIWIFNTHLDHMGVRAKIEGLKLIIAVAKEKTNDFAQPAIITGDFNMPEHQFKKIIDESDIENAKIIAKKQSGPSGTFTGWYPGSGATIDYILIASKAPISVNEFVVYERPDKKFLSDHRPVFVDISF